MEWRPPQTGNENERQVWDALYSLRNELRDKFAKITGGSNATIQDISQQLRLGGQAPLPQPQIPGNVFYQQLGIGGATKTQERRLNLIAGSNITLTYADNPGSNSSDVTVTATGGGGNGSGAMVLLEQHTANNSAELDFTTWYSVTYDDYWIEFVCLTVSANGAKAGIQMSTNGGVAYDTGNNYFYFDGFSGTGGTGGDTAPGNPANSMSVTGGTITINNSATGGGVVGTVKLYDPANTTSFKHFVYQMGAPWSGSTGYYSVYGIGYWASASAANAFRLIPSTGTFLTGTVRVYGIAKA